MSLEVKIPAMGESISEVVLARWLKNSGDFVRMDEPVCEIESDKASMEIPAPASGVITIKKELEGQTLPVGSVIATIEEKEAPAEKEEVSTGTASFPEVNAPTGSTEVSEKSRITHVAARMLESAGISLEHATSGTGPGGKFTRADAERLIASYKKEQPSEALYPQPQSKLDESTGPEISIPTVSRTFRREKMTTLRKTIANRLLEAKNQTAMLTTFNEVDMSEILRLREKYNPLFKEKFGIKLGFMSFFTKAVTIALQEFPAVNAQIDGDEIVYFEYCDIGIAVSTDRGLMVPVIRNAETLSLAQIEAEIARLAEKARTGKITIDELSGGTFSITNGGVFGSLLATPLINYPQTAILGMHAVQERPVVRDGQIVIRPMMYIALSYDHRLIDGKESVSFLKRVKEILEDPVRLVLEI